MFGEKALDLVRELKRTQDGNLPPYNEDGIRQVVEEMRSLFEQNQLEVKATTDGERGLLSGPGDYSSGAPVHFTRISASSRYPVEARLLGAKPALPPGVRPPPHDPYQRLPVADG